MLFWNRIKSLSLESNMMREYWTEQEKRNLLNILKGQEALRELNKKK